MNSLYNALMFMKRVNYKNIDYAIINGYLIENKEGTFYNSNKTQMTLYQIINKQSELIKNDKRGIVLFTDNIDELMD